MEALRITGISINQIGIETKRNTAMTIPTQQIIPQEEMMIAMAIENITGSIIKAETIGIISIASVIQMAQIMKGNIITIIPNMVGYISVLMISPLYSDIHTGITTTMEINFIPIVME
ncbi:MAG TPA: hypothetical protein DCL77_08305 [Prolixibacteraceae bacterium]|nr:hypothetical protein [Prolixibacteraceae bacterium]